MHERLERICLRVLQFGLPIAFLTPLVYISETTFPFVVGKVWSFRLVVDLLLPFFAVLLAVSPRRRPRRAPLVVAVGAYMAVLLLSAAFGVDPWRSLWSNHERMTGVVAMLHYAAFFLMCATAYRTRREWRMALLASLGASAVMTVLALWERGHPGFMANTSGRPWATLGNTIYLANYLLFHLFFIAILVVRRSMPPFVRVVLAALGALQLLVLLFTQTRGTLLAVIVTAAVLLLWLSVRERKFRKAGIGALAALVLVLGVLYANRAQPAVQNIPGLGRLLNTSLSDTGGVRTRFIAWEIALQAFQDKPLLGWGPENYYYAFNAHYYPESYRYSQYETWFDRSHNTLLDILSMTGALGAVAYAAVFAAAFWTLERKIRAGETPKWEGMLTGGMLLAYVLQNVTVFDSHTSYLYFYLLLAMVAARPLPEQASGKPLGGAALGAVAAAAAALGIGAAAWSAVMPFQANRLGLIGTSYARLRGDLPNAIAAYDRALALPTQHRVDLRADGAREVIAAAMGQPSTDVARRALDWAAQRMEENRAARPRDVYDTLVLTQAYAALSADVPELLERARATIEEGLRLSPGRQQVIYTFAQVAQLQGKIEDAITVLEESRAAEEAVAETHWYLAAAYDAVGRREDALAALRRARELRYRYASLGDIAFAARVLRAGGDGEGAKREAETLVQAAPNDGSAHLILAEILADLGEHERARSEAERARQLSPGLNADVILLLSRIR